MREGEEYLAQVADRLGTLAGKQVECPGWSGPAPYAIVEAAGLYKVDMIVMTTHGRTGPRRLLVGSVAAGVLRSAPVLVLLLKAGERSP